MIGRQLLRSGTSVGANYRAVCRSRSLPEFIAKLGVVIEEADESLYWLEMMDEASVMPGRRLTALMKEAGEFVAIFTAARQTARANLNSKSKTQN